MTLEQHLADQYWEKHHDFLPAQVDEWKRGVAKRREELFADSRNDPIPGYKVDWNQIENELFDNRSASRIGVTERRAKKKAEERAKDAEFRKKRKRDAMLSYMGKDYSNGNK